MKKRALTCLFVMSLAVSLPFTARAEMEAECPDLGLVPEGNTGAFRYDANGHYYKAVYHPKIRWPDAKHAAEDMTFEDPATGISYPGNLVIITTAGEDCFVENVRRLSVAENHGKPEYWAGAEQDEEAAAGDPTAAWSWIIPEAPFDLYTNWQDEEPNDFQGREEMYLGLGHRNVFGWNDESNRNNIGGYIVEFVVESMTLSGEDLETCFGDLGCPVTTDGALTIILPDTVTPVGEPVVTLSSDDGGIGPTLSATTYRLTDDPARCGIAPLPLFRDADGVPRLIISPNHCATPETGNEFIVVFTELDGLEIREGTVEVIQEAKAALPAFPYVCDRRIEKGTSLNNQEVVIYQRTNKEDMREFGTSWGPFVDVPAPPALPDSAGATSDITDRCGSSRARRAQNSWSVIGMVQRFDPGSEFETNPDLNFLRWNELARYKLELLLDAIEASRPALDDHEFRFIKRQAQVALRRFDRGLYRLAIFRLNILLWKVENIATYDTTATDNNDQGETIERAGSTRFILKKILRFRPPSS